MNLTDIWRDVSKRILFFTKETQSQIPEAPGVYAWFLPLYLYNNNLSELLRVLYDVLLYDSNSKGIPTQRVPVNFKWDVLRLTVKKGNPPSEMSEMDQKKWNALLESKEGSEALQKILMEASIFMPPLYVGKTKDLRQRYNQHVTGKTNDENNFHRRFTSHIKSLASIPALTVSDLIFACVLTDRHSSAMLDAKDLTDLLENLLLRLCRPPFSER